MWCAKQRNVLSGPQISTVSLADTHEFLKKTESITCIVPRSRLPISLWVLSSRAPDILSTTVTQVAKAHASRARDLLKSC